MIAVIITELYGREASVVNIIVYIVKNLMKQLILRYNWILLKCGIEY